MSRESRTLLILVVFAIAAVVALGYLAQRYGKMLEGRNGGPGSKKVTELVLPAAETASS